MSASPLSGLVDGQIQRDPGNPIPRVGEPTYAAPPAKLLVVGGLRGPDATDADWARLAARLQPVAYREPAKREQWGLPQPAASLRPGWMRTRVRNRPVGDRGRLENITSDVCRAAVAQHRTLQKAADALKISRRCLAGRLAECKQ